MLLRRHVRAVVGLGVLIGGFESPVWAQESNENVADRAWANATELSWVVATGNAEANTMGFRNLYQHEWGDATLTWEAGWVRAASHDGDRVAKVSADGGFEIVDPPTEIDSQRLFSKVGLRQELAAPHFWFANYDSVRDEPSNINRQFVVAGGLGTLWVDRDDLRFRTQYGVSVTNEDLVLEGTNSFGGYRLSYALQARAAGGSRIDSELTFDGSFQEADDMRADWLNGINVAINSHVALRSSLRVLFRNVPALEKLDLIGPALGVVGAVEVPKGRVDTNVTTSLVITF